MQDRRNAGQERCRTGGMQDRRNAGPEGCRRGVMPDRKNAGQEGCRTGGIQDRRDAEDRIVDGQNVCKTSEVHVCRTGKR